MGDRTGIAWTDATWNPIVGCSVISPGCANCYAMRMAARLQRMDQPIYRGMTRPGPSGPVWTGRVEASNWGQVIRPLLWRRPRRIFVNSMSDLFHEALPDIVRDLVFAVMANCPQHTFQILTKRADVMLRYVADPGRLAEVSAWMPNLPQPARQSETWPLLNVQLGVSVEDQTRARQRIPLLTETPAAVRLLSCEPLLGQVELRPWLDGGRIGWVIIGGESGPRARPMFRRWAEDLLRQCQKAGTPAFFKQVGSNRHPIAGWPDAITGKGDIPDQWPEAMQVQDFPRARKLFVA